MDKKIIIGLVIAAAAILALPALAAPDHSAAIERLESNLVKPEYQN